MPPIDEAAVMGAGDERYAKKFSVRRRLRQVLMVLMGLAFLVGMMWGSFSRLMD